MSVIYVKNRKWDCADEASQQNCTIEEWMAAFCPVKICSICGEDLWARNFLFWRGEQEIAICERCAEHTLAGLNRDLSELMGQVTRIKDRYFGKGNQNFNILELNKKLVRLQKGSDEYQRRIIALQELLARQNER